MSITLTKLGRITSWVVRKCLPWHFLTCSKLRARGKRRALLVASRTYTSFQSAVGHPVLPSRVVKRVFHNPARKLLGKASRHVSGKLRNTRKRVQVSPPAKRRRNDAIERLKREQVKEAALALICKWEPVMGVKVASLKVRHMTSRWGSCTPRRGTIRLSTRLIERAPEFLEYVVVHEMAHLLEPSHGRRFKELMDQFLPGWREVVICNQLPVQPV